MVILKSIRTQKRLICLNTGSLRDFLPKEYEMTALSLRVSLYKADTESPDIPPTRLPYTYADCVHSAIACYLALDLATSNS